MTPGSVSGGLTWLVACSAAQAANTSGVVISAEPGSDVVHFMCEGRECELPLSIWATSVPHAFAQELQLVGTFPARQSCTQLPRKPGGASATAACCRHAHTDQVVKAGGASATSACYGRCSCL